MQRARTKYEIIVKMQIIYYLIFAYYYTYEYTTIYNFAFLVTTFLGSIFRDVQPP